MKKTPKIIYTDSLNNEYGVDLIVDLLFEELEPFIKGVLEDHKHFTLPERMKYHHCIEYLDINPIDNVYDIMYDKFQERIAVFFERITKKYQRMQSNELLMRKLKEEITHYDEGRKLLVSLFRSTDAYFIGCSYSITKLVKEEWENMYYAFVKNEFKMDLTKVV